MKTSPLSKVSASIPVSKKSKFNLSHDVNTTYDFGSVQPLFGKLMLPDSSINVNNEQLTRLAPMVVPTFGRVKIKNIAHFVPCEEIYPNWDAMMSQTKVTRSALTANGTPSASTYVPKNVPFINNNILAVWCLAGAKVNFYFSGAVGTDAENSWTCPYNGGSWASPTWSAATTAVRGYLQSLTVITSSDSPSTSTITALGYTGYRMSLRKLLLDASGNQLLNVNGADAALLPTISTMSCQPLANANGEGYTHSASNEMNKYTLSTVNEAITFDGADMIWEYAGSDPTAGISAADRAANSGTPVEGIGYNLFDGCKIRIVFKLSSFGKRMRKILIGLGYDVNLSNSDRVSILPLIAFYKAWWDSYAPERYKNFYETNAWKLINASMIGATGADLLTWINDANGGDVRRYFAGFMGDLGTCFATDKMDVISAATDKYYASTNTTTDNNNVNANTAAINQALQAALYDPMNGVAGPDGSFNVYPSTGSNNAYTTPRDTLTLAIQTYPAALTQPQIDALKKAYIMINKTSVAGMKVEEILRSIGQGDYVEECKGKFITSTDDMVKISDVVATAATDDAQLGQYGGRGIGFGKFQFSFSTGRYGYLIVLSAIVPEAGYVNSPVHENEAISFETMYQPEFDGLAYEAIQKKQITGSPLVSDASYAETFGFLPTYSQWKFMSNKANGDFSLNSRKASYLPYTLDKYIPVANANTYGIIDDANHAGTKVILCSPTFKYSDLPNAGEDYRYVNKFPWNGNFNRIFSQQGYGLEWSVYSPNNNSFLFNSFEYDNFLCHNVFQVSYYAHMKSIEDSYGTFDEEHGAPNTSVTRS